MDSFETITEPPRQLVEFVKQLVRETVTARVEERQEQRYKVAIPVVVQSLDLEFRPTAESFKAMSRDISPGGIGLIHTRALKEKHLLLRLETNSGDQMAVVMEVLRCRPIGLFYDIGGRFIAKKTSVKKPADEAGT